MKRKKISKQEQDRRFTQSKKWIDEPIPRKNASGAAKIFAIIILTTIVILVSLAFSSPAL